MAQGTYKPFKQKLDRKADPTRPESIIGRIFRKYGIDKEVSKYNFVLKWTEIVGEQIAKRTKPEYIRESTLVVRVSDSSWGQELMFYKDVILQRLNKHIGSGDPITDIFFIVGKFSDQNG